MYKYFAYGLFISSEIVLPEFLELDSSHSLFVPDITILLGTIQPFTPDQSLLEDYYQIQDGAFYFSWELSGSYLVENGKTITIQPHPQLGEQALRIPLFGVVMATLLSQRGLLVMHASAVEIQGQAVAFVGHKGQGKSTMSAVLTGLGYPLIADDVVAIHFNSWGKPMLSPGIPMFKLWPDAVEAAFQEDPESLSKVHPIMDKRSRLAKDNFSRQPVPLQTLYVLETTDTGKTAKIQVLSPQSALSQIFVHSYMARFGNRLLQGASGANHFQACSHLLKHAEICSLQRPRDLTLLPTISQKIVDRLVLDESMITVNA